MPQKRKQNVPGKASRPKRRSSSYAKSSSYSRNGFSISNSPEKGIGQHASRNSSSNQFGSSSFGNVRSSVNGQGSKKSFTPEVVLTRRNLLIGAAGIGGVALLGGVGSMALDAIDGPEVTIEYLEVPESAVTNLESYSEVAADDYVSLVGSFELTYGTLVWADNDYVAACLVPGKTSSPLNTVSLLFLSTGANPEVLSAAIGTSEHFEIFDARCSENGVVWTECNVLENRWRVYTAQLSGADLGEATLVDEGDSNWLTPSIAAVGNTAFWQASPQTTGENSKDNSVLKAARFGSKESSVVYSSKRVFATRVCPVADGVVITPRVDSTSVYYQLTKIDESTLQTSDSLVLPTSMKPYEASWGETGFSFAFESIYNYGGGIANLGTYTPLSKPAAYSYQNIPWFHFGRTPSSAPSWCGEWFAVKSTRAICAVNVTNSSYFMIDVPNGTDSYGEYLVSSGNNAYIVGLSQITNVDDKEKNHALVRVYSPR